jgi:hypothetical protein
MRSRPQRGESHTLVTSRVSAFRGMSQRFSTHELTRSRVAKRVTWISYFNCRIFVDRDSEVLKSQKSTEPNRAKAIREIETLY